MALSFEEYTKTEVFRRESARLKVKKSLQIILFIGFLLTAAFLVAGTLLLSEETPPTRDDIPAYILIGASAVIGVVVGFFRWKTVDRMDDGISRRPAFSAALLLYARERLAGGWSAENGIIAFDLDFPSAEKGAPVASFALVRRECLRINFSEIAEGLDVFDAYMLAIYSLFSWLEESNVSAEEISYRVLENGLVQRRKRGGKFMLYAAGKWTLLGKGRKREYRNIVKYARKKGLID